MLWCTHALETQRLLWFGHGCYGEVMLLEHERYYDLGMDALVIVCSRNERYYGLGIDALVGVCPWNTNVIMVWAWMLEMCKILLEHGGGCTCSKPPRTQGPRVDMPPKISSKPAWMLWCTHALETQRLLWFGHGCYGEVMLLEHERYYDLGMDALVIVCSRNTNVIMVWAWMLW